MAAGQQGRQALHPVPDPPVPDQPDAAVPHTGPPVAEPPVTGPPVAEPPVTGPPVAGPWDEAALEFERWRSGERAALDRLVRLLTPVLWHVVRAYRLPTEAAEDVVQTTWLTLVRKADSVRDGQAVSRWLTVTARREAWRVGRATQADRRDDETVLAGVPDAGPGPEQALLAHASSAALWTAVARLDERCRRLLRVVAFEDRPDYRTLSEELSMPVGSIGPTRGRCLSKLREQLAADPAWGAR